MRKELVIVFIFIFSGIALVTFYVPVVNFVEIIFNSEEVYLRKERELLGNTKVVNPKVKEMQKALTSLGFKLGVVDGKLGDKTRFALKTFQKKNKFKATGFISEETLMELKRQAKILDEYNQKKKAASKKKKK